MSVVSAFLSGGIIGAAIGIAVYHFGFSTIHTKLDQIIASVKK